MNVNYEFSDSTLDPYIFTLSRTAMTPQIINYMQHC